MSEDVRLVSGALFRAPDGNLYFVPESALDQFRVFEEVRAQLEERLPVDHGDEAMSVEDGGEEIEVEDSALQAVFTTLELQPRPHEGGLVGLAFCHYLLDRE